MSALTYTEFLEAKAALAVAGGLQVDASEVHPILKPHQRDAVVWAVRGGRRAVFASFGLGKTLIQLEIVRLVLAKLGRGRGLIVLPLGVRQEFVRDARLLGLEVRFIRTVTEASSEGIYLTNYESVRDGKLDPRAFDVVSLDEAAVLRGFGGTKTFREFMRLYEGSDNYRFVATATPSPNEYIELLAYAAFLDVMDVGQAKTRFFKRDSTKADKLTLLPHMEADFWLWVSSWALFLQKPSDLGHSDEGYVLPPLEVVWHEVPSQIPAEGVVDRKGRAALFADAAIVTDVVRENNQTYRLGWTEQCKDGTKMGAGLPEYLLLFRKPPTDASNGYADEPVVKSKADFSRHRWQVDAHGFARSNGDRPLAPEDLVGLPADEVFRLFRDHNLTHVYDYEAHVAAGEALEAKRRLPSGFMLLQPPSWHPDVWTDVARMRTLNMMQERKGQQFHLCPLQFDIVERLINQFSMRGETVFDPFAGLMTVPYCAIKMGRRGLGVELNRQYFRDGVAYVEAADREASLPTLFDLVDLETRESA